MRKNLLLAVAVAAIVVAAVLGLTQVANAQTMISEEKAQQIIDEANEVCNQPSVLVGLMVRNGDIAGIYCEDPQYFIPPTVAQVQEAALCIDTGHVKQGVVFCPWD